MTKHDPGIDYLVEQLLAFGLQNHMIEESDVVYTRNQLLDLLKVSEPYPGSVDISTLEVPETATPILEQILDYAAETGLLPDDTLTQRDLLDTRIMGLFMPRPSAVIHRFEDLKKYQGVQAAADDFYGLCQKSDYIRVNRIARNLKWNHGTSFGTLEITINLTKPEKDPKEIAALKSAPQSGYPKCLLCPENVGYQGRINHPARQTLRTLPMNLDGETWHFQYSPYVYYNQHCIVLSEKHVPMKIKRNTFVKLLNFLDHMPHYFIGSNADLPIVGGSILNHDHFQGGYHQFPMEKAPIEYAVTCSEFPDIELGVVHWPMSVLRMRSTHRDHLVHLADKLLGLWREYSDPSADILAYTTDSSGKSIPHNTITPIARKNADGRFELDLVLRNNRTTPEHPMGIFHPHQEIHHIKKENIGLIEVMGLFILPGRLQMEMSELQKYLTGEEPLRGLEEASQAHPLYKHLPWLKEILSHHGSQLTSAQAHQVLQAAVGEKCLQVLHHAGVFKTDSSGREAFNRFLHHAGIQKKI